MTIFYEVPVHGFDDQLYVSLSGMTFARENGRTPNGNWVLDRWVLRDEVGEWIDFDQFRYDLAERNHIVLSNLDDFTIDYPSEEEMNEIAAELG